MTDDTRRHLIGAHFLYGGMPTITMQLSGNYPVQAEGNIEGDKYYFRARHEEISIEIYDGENTENIIWQQSLDYVGNAGWMPLNLVLHQLGIWFDHYWKSIGAYRCIEKRFGKELLDKFKKDYARRMGVPNPPRPERRTDWA